MSIRDAIPEEMARAMRQMADDVELARELGVEPGTLTHEGLVTLREIRAGATGQRLSQRYARAKRRSGDGAFSWRVAAVQNEISRT